MKYVVLSLTLLASAHHVFAMNEATPAASATSQNQEVDNELTREEIECFEWFEKHAKEDPSYFKQLPAEDQEVFNQRIKFQENPEKIKRSRTSVARAFLAQMVTKGITPKCDEGTLAKVLVKVAKNLHAPKSDTIKKPTNLLSARTYVWSQLMTEDQRAAWSKKAYEANPRHVEAVTIEWSMLLANKLAEIGLIENTEAAIAQKAQELFNDKWATLQKMYTNSAAAPAAQ